MNQKVRVRFAPSPTGHLHLGGARSALYNWAYARHTTGTFVLRIEDTDVDRSTKESESELLEDLKWLGIVWDEGPDVGGAFGPYRQSERLDLYKKYAQQLVDAQDAFLCFCTDEVLEAKREKALAEGKSPHYDGACRHLSQDQVTRQKKAGVPFSIRFKVGLEDEVLEDAIRGTVHFNHGMVGDFVILRSNGYPTYNFACVVDDGLMQITHVIRAEEHLSNTNRQIKLYRALGFHAPKFAHLSLVHGKDEEGNVSKLSKRHGATSVDQYKKEGFCREALVNYLVLLGWSHPEEKDVFREEEMYSLFSLERVGRSPSLFDRTKLVWMNGIYIREHIPEGVLVDQLKGFVDPDRHAWFLKRDRAFQELVVSTIKPKLELLSDINLMLELLLPWSKAELDESAREFLKTSTKSSEVIRSLHKTLEKNPGFLTALTVDQVIKTVQTETGAKGKDLFMGIRVGVTGSCHGLDLKKMMEILGHSECLNRASLVWDASSEE